MLVLVIPVSGAQYSDLALLYISFPELLTSLKSVAPSKQFFQVSAMLKNQTNSTAFNSRAWKRPLSCFLWTEVVYTLPIVTHFSH